MSENDPTPEDEDENVSESELFPNEKKWLRAIRGMLEKNPAELDNHLKGFNETQISDAIKLIDFFIKKNILTNDDCSILIEKLRNPLINDIRDETSGRTAAAVISENKSQPVSVDDEELDGDPEPLGIIKDLADLGITEHSTIPERQEVLLNCSNEEIKKIAEGLFEMKKDYGLSRSLESLVYYLVRESLKRNIEIEFLTEEERMNIGKRLEVIKDINDTYNIYIDMVPNDAKKLTDNQITEGSKKLYTELEKQNLSVDEWYSTLEIIANEAYERGISIPLMGLGDRVKLKLDPSNWFNRFKRRKKKEEPEDDDDGIRLTDLFDNELVEIMEPLEEEPEEAEWLEDDSPSFFTRFGIKLWALKDKTGRLLRRKNPKDPDAAAPESEEDEVEDIPAESIVVEPEPTIDEIIASIESFDSENDLVGAIDNLSNDHLKEVATHFLGKLDGEEDGEEKSKIQRVINIINSFAFKSRTQVVTFSPEQSKALKDLIELEKLTKDCEAEIITGPIRRTPDKKEVRKKMNKRFKKLDVRFIKKYLHAIEVVQRSYDLEKEPWKFIIDELVKNARRLNFPVARKDRGEIAPSISFKKKGKPGLLIQPSTKRKAPDGIKSSPVRKLKNRGPANGANATSELFRARYGNLLPQQNVPAAPPETEAEAPPENE
jgi:hypothetical protein